MQRRLVPLGEQIQLHRWEVKIAQNHRSWLRLPVRDLMEGLGAPPSSLTLARACIMVSWAACQTRGHLEMFSVGASGLTQPHPATPACQSGEMAVISCLLVPWPPKGARAWAGQAGAGVQVNPAPTRCQALPGRFIHLTHLGFTASLLD